MPLVYSGADLFANIGPGTADATVTDARFPVPIATQGLQVQLWVTARSLPAGPYTFNLYKNNVFVASLFTIANSDPLGLFTAGPSGFPFAAGDTIQIKGVPSGGGGTGSLSFGGVLYLTPP